ncbi:MULTISPECIES: acyl-CoA dehydrogenase family protein [unclassified Streptomyces]|uniref:acyl-CoA dehydrogenase family protein n=1 Tax=unclassified Streptomyces TaxID=2593676 RepID=UPI00380F1395
MTTTPQDPSLAVSLERALGDPRDEASPGSFARSVRADRKGAFPGELCDAAFAWGVADQLVPEAYGGRLRALEECFALSRVLSRRDLTATVAIGASLLASLPVWLRGTTEQRHTVAALLRSRAFLSFALSEREHGADIIAGEVTARTTDGGWRIDGTKWLINNAGHASAATVTARTGTGFRGLTLFLLTRSEAGADAWTPLPGIATHGLSGSAFGGITFTDLPARDSDVIGKKGQGLEILLETLQITRVMVGSFALGALDTCLRAALDFARSRTLYGAPIVTMEPVARRLVDAYTDVLIGETLALGACRAAHLAPDQLPLMSACVKYLVPRTATDSIESLSGVLGARSYLAEEHWHGIFEKMRRDCSVTTLFDGSSPVNLQAIVEQLPGLARARSADQVTDVPSGLFAPAPPALDWVAAEDLELATDADAVLHGLTAAYRTLRDGHHTLAPRRELLELLEWFGAETDRLDTETVRNAGDADWNRSGAAYDLAARYSHLHAAGACAWKWLNWCTESSDPFIADGTWLVLCLRRIATRIGREPIVLDDIDRAALARLERAHDDQYLFSDLDFPLG